MKYVTLKKTYWKQIDEFKSSFRLFYLLDTSIIIYTSVKWVILYICTFLT